MTALPAHANSKVDPLLVQVYNAVNSISPYNALSTPMLSNSVTSRSPSGEIMVNVVLKTTSPDRMKQFIINNYGSVGTSINGILTATVPLSLAPVLAEKRSLINMELSRKLHPLLDMSVPAVRGDVVHAGTGLPRPYTGKNVIIGIIDTGLDLTHTDFHYADGSTRVIALWDQTASGTPPTGYAYGEACTGYQINTGKCKEIDTVGHGTHVAGITGSNNNQYTGMAPDAMLVIVKTNMDESGILDGIGYIFSLASQYHVPAVINMSLGAQYYAHDNSSNTEQAIDGLVNGAPGRAVVVAAGNDGANTIHLGLTAAANSSYASYFSVVASTTGSVNTAEIQLWYYTTTATNSNLSFALGVINTSGNILTSTSFTTPTALNAQTLSAPLSSSLSSYGSAVIAGASAANGSQVQNEIVLQISDNGSSSINLTNSMSVYRYVLFIKNNSAFAQPLNAWFDSENALFDTYITIPPSGGGPSTLVYGDTSDTVSFPATAKDAIAVGSFVTRNEWPTEASLTQPACISLDGGAHCYEPPIGSLSFFSSNGPTPDPAATGQKPNITAPGEVIVSALSTQASFPTSQTTPDGKHLADLGTSMACPHVTGAVALLFDRDNGLDITDTINLLETSATHDTYTTLFPNNNWGYGKLDALNLVNAVTATTITTATGPVISGVNTAKIGTSNAEISWTTDRLSTSYVKYWIASRPTGTTVFTGTTTMTEEHIVNLNGLNSNTNYAYQVISADPYGNTSVYPSNGGANSLKTSKSSSSGCMCAQSSGRFNAGDMFPFLLLLLGWVVIMKLSNPRKRESRNN